MSPPPRFNQERVRYGKEDDFVRRAASRQGSSRIRASAGLQASTATNRLPLRLTTTSSHPPSLATSFLNSQQEPVAPSSLATKLSLKSPSSQYSDSTSVSIPKLSDFPRSDYVYHSASSQNSVSVKSSSSTTCGKKTYIYGSFNPNKYGNPLAKARHSGAAACERATPPSIDQSSDKNRLETEAWQLLKPAAVLDQTTQTLSVSPDIGGTSSPQSAKQDSSPYLATAASARIPGFDHTRYDHSDARPNQSYLTPASLAPPIDFRPSSHSPSRYAAVPSSANGRMDDQIAIPAPNQSSPTPASLAPPIDFRPSLNSPSRDAAAPSSANGRMDDQIATPAPTDIQDGDAASLAPPLDSRPSSHSPSQTAAVASSENGTMDDQIATPGSTGIKDGDAASLAPANDSRPISYSPSQTTAVASSANGRMDDQIATLEPTGIQDRNTTSISPEGVLSSKNAISMRTPRRSQTPTSSSHGPVETGDGVAPVITNTARQNGSKKRRSTASKRQSQEIRNNRKVKDVVDEEKLARLRVMQAQETKDIGQRLLGQIPSTETTSRSTLELARRPVPEEVQRHIPQTQAIAYPGTSEAPTRQDTSGSPSKDSWRTSTVSRKVARPIKSSPAQPLYPESKSDVTETAQDGLTSRTPRSLYDKQAPPQHPKEADEASKHSRWATTAELKPIQARMELDSNAWGSDMPSDAEIESNDSTKRMHHGKLFRKNPPATADAPLYNQWDGSWAEPPIDWNDRPRFNNNSPEFRNGFNHWNDATARLSCPVGDGMAFARMSVDRIKNIDLHADGLDLVEHDFTIDVTSIEKYGYTFEVVADDILIIAKSCQRLQPEDFEDWGKVDESIGANATHKNETTEELVQNWNAHQSRSREEHAVLVQESPVDRYLSYKPAPNPHAPRVNIYLRPAVRTDISQLTALYNWYVEHSPRASELKPIDARGMEYRFVDSTSAKLPFLVAVSKSGKINRRLTSGVEKIVGFASAVDFSGALMAERFTAELEVYVHHDWLQRGVGKCLLDKLLEATDRGHIAKGGYDFTCDPALKYCYEAGGGRNLHTLLFIIRHFKIPDPKNANSTEHDYDKWLKSWLIENWDFEEQGYLKSASAKFSRWVNISYLCKETKWQPTEGHIPEYFPSSE